MKRQERYTFFSLLLLLSLFLLSFNCFCQADHKPCRIAVTKLSPNYERWLRQADSTLVIVDMIGLNPDAALNALTSCSGLLLTGGEDVNPVLYGKAAEAKLCQDINDRRDTLESALLRKALFLKMPVLGICRGEQMINVVLGGTLIVDIPSWNAKNQSAVIKDTDAEKVTHQCDDWQHCCHAVTAKQGTQLRAITGTDTCTVTTNHHQAVARLAPALQCNAVSPDGITEGIEWENPSGKSFLLGVQWHPERMEPESGFSRSIAKAFLLQIKSYDESKKP